MVELAHKPFYNEVENNCKGGKNVRKAYIDNIKWITVVLVVLHHVIYMFNGIETYGVIGPFSKPILFVIMIFSGTGPLWYIQML